MKIKIRTDIWQRTPEQITERMITMNWIYTLIIGINLITTKSTFMFFANLTAIILTILMGISYRQHQQKTR